MSKAQLNSLYGMQVNTIPKILLKLQFNVSSIGFRYNNRYKRIFKIIRLFERRIKMELELEDKLQQIYHNIKVEVKYKDIRQYEVITILEYKGVEHESKIEYWYDATLTFDANISKIENIIDNKIIIPFYKKKGE